MKLDATLDTSATTTAICIVDRRDGAILLETTVTTYPDAVFRALKPYATRLHLVGHEATSWSAWLHRELEARGIPMVLLETHHAARMLKASATRPTRMRWPSWCGPAGSTTANLRSAQALSARAAMPQTLRQSGAAAATATPADARPADCCTPARVS